jgi:hypothetical protein
MFILELSCCAYGGFEANASWRDVEVSKSMSQAVINVKNNASHFQEVHSLDIMMRSCEAPIQEWPELERKYPAQATIISNYRSFKKLLPETFCELFQHSYSRT